MLRLRLLGELAVEVEGHAAALPSGRAGSLLAWLALHPGLHPRAEVAARFWPEIVDESARASLRTALWELRRSLGPRADAYLVATRNRVGLAGEPEVWADVRAFDDLVRSGRLEEALALGTGELLSGLGDEWAYEARDSHRERVSDVLGRVARDAEEAGQLERALAFARHRASLDPLSEEAARQLIRLLTASGDRASALATYRRFRNRLRAQLGIAPSPATRALVEEIRAAGPEAAASAGGDEQWEPGSGRPFPLPPRLASRDLEPFVGRQAELERLRALSARATSSATPGLVVVTGEPGIGKTRLAGEFARVAGGDGAIVLYGRTDSDPVVPYQPFVEAVRHYARSCSDEELSRRAGPHAAALARLVPELQRRLPGAGGDATAAMELRRYELFEGLAGLLTDLSEFAPVVLVLDDLHWVDKPTALLLKHVVRSARPARLFLIGAYRDSDVTAADPLGEVVAELAREGSCERIHLTGLTEEEVAALIRSTLELARVVHAETAGNPFFVEALVRHLRETGELAEAAANPELVLRRAPVPTAVEDLVALRLAKLGDDSVQALRLAAVAGQGFELAVLQRASGLDPAELEDALESARSTGLLVESPDEPGRYNFVHALVRQALYRGLPGARRVRLHQRIAESIEEVHAADLEAYLDPLAHHFREGRSDKAADYAARAGDQARARLAFERAIGFYTAALEALPPGHEARARELLAKRAVASQALEHTMFDRPARTSPGSRPV